MAENLTISQPLMLGLWVMRLKAYQIKVLSLFACQVWKEQVYAKMYKKMYKYKSLIGLS